MARTVTTIPATLTTFSSKPLESKEKRKVAAYARVSTDKDEQFTSFEAQKNYYERFIKEHDDWEFVDVYADEGITGTHTEHREGFLKMISDAKNGKIDLIITKSISRFARNTVDTLVAVRELKMKGIECYFEKENIWTLDNKSEVVLTIMSSFAQEESRSISENTSWGWKKRFEDGKVSLAYSRFLGYDKGENGTLKKNPEQAPIVRRIYDLFLEGMTTKAIATKLSSEGVHKANGKTNWKSDTVVHILTNEKYTGNAILQKTFKTDLLSKRKVNNGEVKKYYVQNAFEGIVSQEEFDVVQDELRKRALSKNTRTTCRYVFSNKIVCGDCGTIFGSKLWHSNDKYRKEIWQCNKKFTNEKKCTTPHFTSEELGQIFVKALNQLAYDKESHITDLLHLKDVILNTSEKETALQKAKNELSDSSILIEKYISSGPVKDTDLINDRFDELSERCKIAEDAIYKLTKELNEIRTQKANISLAIKNIKKLEQNYTNFSDSLFSGLCEKMTIYSKDRIIVTFKSGIEIQSSL